MSASNAVRLVSAVVICQLAGVVGSYFTAPSVTTWYASLQKPVFAPPNWLFAPVWITLYTLMGISAYLIWIKGLGNREVRIALLIFAVQLVVNTLWSYLFFGLESPFYGLVGIAILWAAITLTIWKFLKISRRAGILLLPYIGWVSIAMLLNFYIWLLNP